MADYAIHDTTLSGIANVIRKKDGTSALIDPADYEDRIDLMGMLEEKTASGSVVAFEDGADDVKLKSYVATIDPTLTGTDSVDVVQTGKNIVDFSGNINASAGGFSFSATETGGIVFSGTSTGTWAYITQKIPFRIPSGTTITFSRDSVFSVRHYLQLTFDDESTRSMIIPDNDVSVSYTLAKDITHVRAIMSQLTQGESYSGTVYFQLEIGSTASAYESFVTPTTHTADLDRTIYGGSVDVVNGTGSETHDLVPFSDCTWSVVTSYQSNFNADNGIISLRFSKNAMSTAGYEQTATGVICNVFDNNNRSVWNNASRLNEIGYTDGISVNLHYSDIGLSEWTTNSADTLSAWRSSQLYLTGVFALVKADPESFTFDPVEIRSLLGSNTMWADTGASSVVYRSSGTETVIQPTLISKTITANGTYSAEDDGADGYDEVTVNVSGGGGNAPEASQTLICDNSSYASSLTFTDDYADYDLLKFVLYRSDTAGEFVFYMTPAMVDAMWQYSNNLLNFNQPYGNNFVTYQKSSNTAWTRYGRRNMDIKYVYGLTFTNCTCTETELYNRRGNGSSSVTFTPPTGDSFLDYDYILFATCTGSNDETEPCLDVLRPKAEKDIFGSPNTQQESVMVYKYNSGGSLVTVTSNTITSYAYFYVSGLKLSF